ncbi:MAG: winged helix-turn-helix domain-containing protein [Bdellovibrionales bacterium]
MTPNTLLELGRLYCERGDFHQAEPKLNEAAQIFHSIRDFDNFLETQNLLLRLYAEREQFEKIQALKEKLQDFVLKEGFALNSRTYYTLGLAALYRNQADLALDYGQKALALALQADNKKDICYAIFHIAHTYSLEGINRLQDALKEIYNLQVFFQVMDLPDLKASTFMLNARILCLLKKYDEAIEVAWKAYDLLKVTKNPQMSLSLLGLLGWIYAESGDKEMGRFYVSLLNRSLDPQNYVRTAKMARALSERLGSDNQNQFDLVFDETQNAVLEKKLGKIDFKNQFILLDLLKLFVQNPGTVFSKEYLVENVWRQPYDPSVHDNKIYVTIKRLRKMIEPDFDKPKYIFRAKNGYFMNKSARVYVEQ